ncbi:uncharacterized protein M421DRAFT_54351 [Didymella exigua CBS 183.55]|uniref:Rhodopsin domain-containing protein n=1 Tax=Didymella exigua CBS 183.55 TaxID=1150837 RepID=A0A6A5RXF0_9PLEO|nr:uncharacterized protein M421DRAFT_54351 [Didymella exigua CBS 183.55]KAF1932253.1 hypothetical protein M421DRAFT_54351 [Didymella exigua CBS 183.55]
MSFHQELKSQSWTMYGIGMFTIVVRTIARWRRVRSPSQFAIDDWLMATAVPLFYTGLVVCLNTIAQGGGSNLFPPGQLSTFTEQEIQERIKGSKIVIVSEQCMLNVIWSLKACMLLMFARMTSGTRHIKWIKIVAIYVFVGWVAVQIAFFTACMPFSGYWAIPVSNPQCTTLQHFAIVQATFNLSSDVLIIAVPIPMVVSLNLPIRQKIGLGVLFSMGTFVIIAAILTKVYNLSNVYDTAYMLWYTREASVAVYVANLPGIWPLAREHIRFLRDHTNSYITGQSRMPPYGYGSNYGNLSKQQRSHIRVTVTDVEPDEVELKDSYNRPGARSIHSSPSLTGKDFRSGKTSLDSDERAINDLSSWKGMNVMEVQVDTKVEIRRGGWAGTELQGVQTKTQIEGGCRA